MRLKRINIRTYKTSKIVTYCILTILAILFLLPFLWVVLASLDANASVIVKIPNLTLQNYKDVIANPKNQRAFLIGVFISLTQSFLVVTISGLAAYALSRYQLKYKKPFMLTILFMTGLPITAVMVPVYQMFVFLKFIDSLIATILFLSAASLPYAIWMMKNFMDSVDISLEESAWVDGASTIKGLIKVVLPVMFPGIFTVFIYTFSGSWGNFFVPYILLSSSEKIPASVTIFQFFGSYGQTMYGQLAAYSLLYTIPSVVLYFIGQKYMSEGFSMSGATKG